MSACPFKFHFDISVLHLLLVQATLLAESIRLQREAARLPSTCPSGPHSARRTLMYWAWRHKYGPKHLGAHLAFRSQIRCGFLGSQHMEEIGLFPVCWWGWDDHVPVSRYHIPTHLLLRELAMPQDDWRLTIPGVCLTQEWKAVKGISGAMKHPVDGFLPKYYSIAPCLGDTGFWFIEKPSQVLKLRLP